MPGDDNDDRKQRVLREPVDRLKTEEPRKIGEHAVSGMHDHVLPHQCCDRRHDEKRRDDHDAHDALAEDVIVEQQRNRNTADDGDQKHAADDQKRIPDGLEEGRIGIEILVIEQARKADIGRVQKIVILKREPQGHRQGHDHPDQKQQHRRRHHQPCQPARVSRRHMHPSISGQRAGHCSRCQKAARGSAQGWERVGEGAQHPVSADVAQRLPDHIVFIENAGPCRLPDLPGCSLPGLVPGSERREDYLM